MLDVFLGAVLRDRQPHDAHRLHRLEALFQVEVSRVHLGDVGQDGGVHARTPQDGGVEAPNDGLVVQGRQIVGIHCGLHAGA